MASKSQSKTTTDHGQIRQWAETRNGRPAVVKSTHGRRDDTGILRIDFPGYSGSGSLEEISWEEFFEKFDREKLALVYQETTARGQKSNFNKIVSRETPTSRTRSHSAARKSGSDTGRKRSRPAAKKKPRKAASTVKARARKRSSAGKTSGRKSTGRKAAKRSSQSR